MAPPFSLLRSSQSPKGLGSVAQEANQDTCLQMDHSLFRWSDFRAAQLRTVGRSSAAPKSPPAPRPVRQRRQTMPSDVVADGAPLVKCQPSLPERTWLYGVDRPAREVVYRALDSDFSVRLPLEPFLGTIGVAPAANEARNVLVPEAFGGNMDTPEARRDDDLPRGERRGRALLDLRRALHDGRGRGVRGRRRGRHGHPPHGRCDQRRPLRVATARGRRGDHGAGSYRPLEDAFRIAHTRSSSAGFARRPASPSWTRTGSSRRVRGRRSRTCATPTTPSLRRCPSAISARERRLDEQHA